MGTLSSTEVPDLSISSAPVTPSLSTSSTPSPSTTSSSVSLELPTIATPQSGCTSALPEKTHAWIKRPVDCYLNTCGRDPLLVRGRQQEAKETKGAPSYARVCIVSSDHPSPLDADGYMLVECESILAGFPMGRQPESDEHAAMVLRMLATWPEEQRNAFLLSRSGGLSHNVINPRLCDVCKTNTHPLLVVHHVTCFKCAWTFIRESHTHRDQYNKLRSRFAE